MRRASEANFAETAADRQIFSFDHFNEMQSAIFQSAYDSEENLVVSAPTGSGKTVVFELTFLQMLKDPSTTSRPLAIYMAPTKVSQVATTLGLTDHRPSATSVRRTGATGCLRSRSRSPSSLVIQRSTRCTVSLEAWT